MKDLVCGGLAPDFEFDFQCVFPSALFEDGAIRSALEATGSEQEARANLMPVFCHRAARIAFAEAADRVKEAMWNANWGILAEGAHETGEDEADRTARLAGRIREKIAAAREGRISERVIRLGILQIHSFEAERMKGRTIDPVALRAFETGTPPVLRPLGMWEAQVLIHQADMLRERH
jgi:hypothetical protein